MKILVTGGAGFVGSHTVELLERYKNKVCVVDALTTGKIENLKSFKGQLAITDIRLRQDMENVFSDFSPEAVLHLAAQSAISTSIKDPEEDLEVNTTGTLILLDLAKKYGVKRFVFASTSAVYWEKSTFLNMGMTERWPTIPETPYGISKMAAENYVRTMFPNHMILRYGNIYGPRQVALGENQVVARAFSHFEKGEDFKIIGHGNQKRDFVYVGDIAACNFDALLSNKTGIFNAATGKSHSVNEVLAQIEREYEVKYTWQHSEENDPRGDVYLNCSSIYRNMGWRADYSLAEGIRRTHWWWQGRPDPNRISG